jgi:phage FluMu protein Com
MTAKNTEDLFSIYCPECQKVTDKISFNLLREAKSVIARCPQCQRVTSITYNGKAASIYHQDDDLERILTEK